MTRAFFLLLVAPVVAAAQPEPAPKADVVALARECTLPPTRPGEEAVRLDQAPFPAAVLKLYAEDVPLDDVRKSPATYPLRAKVLETFKTVRDVWATTPELPVPKLKKREGKREKAGLFLTRVPSPIGPALKDDVKAYQVFPATAILKLEAALAELEAVRGLRAKEPKRWRAHFDYAAAECQNRVAFLNEYDLALGYVLREEMPDLDAAKGHTGWRLAGSPKMLSKKDVREMAEAARAKFEAIETEHKDTPWAVLAKHELAAPPGLKWEPAAK